MLRQACEAEQVSPLTRDLSLRRIAAIMAAKGGLVQRHHRRRLPGAGRRGAVDRGQDPQHGNVLLPAAADGRGAPARSAGQRPDVHHPRPAHPGRADRPVRHRVRPGPGPAHGLPPRTAARGGLLDPAGDRPHPGQAVLARPGTPSSRHQLAPPFPGAAAGWKERITRKTPRGRAGGPEAPRTAAANALFTVRAFYLDIAQWAVDDPARWAQWAAPCPIRAEEIPHAKELSRRKARMDQRTRERLPVLPALVRSAAGERDAAAARLAACTAARPGETFTAGGQELRRAVMAKGKAPGPGPRTPRTAAAAT